MTNSDVFGGASRYKQYGDAAAPAPEREVEHEQTFVANGEVGPETTPSSVAGESEKSLEDTTDPARTQTAHQAEETNPFLVDDPLQIFPDEFVEATPAERNDVAEDATRRPEGSPVSGQIVTAEDAALVRQATRSRSAWKAFLAKFGMGTGPSKAELAARQAQQAGDETTIRQQTWTRAVNIGVLNAKGGAGVTPGALLAGGILADVRGGGVGVLELTQSPGSLAFRAEGRPRRGLGELLDQATFIESAGNLAGYTAPQTSHAAVIGSVGARSQLSVKDVSTVRAIVDTYYQVTVSDMDSNLGSAMSLASQRSMDAAIIPCTATNQSLARATETVAHLRDSAPHLFTRSEEPNPVVIVLGHDGAPEDDDVAAGAAQVLRRETHGLVQIVECGYDPIFNASSEISLANALPATRAAWTRALATVVAHINDGTPVTFTEGEQR